MTLSTLNSIELECKFISLQINIRTLIDLANKYENNGDTVYIDG